MRALGRDQFLRHENLFSNPMVSYGKKNGGFLRPAAVTMQIQKPSSYLNFTRAVKPKVRGAPR
jgi:hypothetical protein